MLSWESLKDDDYIPYRTVEIDNEYSLYKEKTKSLDSNIINNVLKNKSEELHLTLNKFPYDLEEGITHYVIWDLKEDKINIETQLERYHNFVKSKFDLTIYDSIIKINKPQYQSIPEIKHCQLFIRDKK